MKKIGRRTYNEASAARQPRRMRLKTQSAGGRFAQERSFTDGLVNWSTRPEARVPELTLVRAECACRLR
jgi:hypothetical protein